MSTPADYYDLARVRPEVIAALDKINAMGPAFALPLALGFASIMKARLLSKLLGAPVSPWRWALVWAVAVGGAIGYLFTLLPHSLEWLELGLGLPVILVSYGAVIWYKGFTKEDRVLFRKKSKEIEAEIVA